MLSLTHYITITQAFIVVVIIIVVVVVVIAAAAAAAASADAADPVSDLSYLNKNTIITVYYKFVSLYRYFKCIIFRCYYLIQTSIT